MRNKKPGNEPHQTDMRTLTLTLTVSLFIVLMTFFIILNSYSSGNAEKAEAATRSLSGSFGVVGTGRAIVYDDTENEKRAGDMEAAAAGLRSALPDVGFESRGTSDGQMMTVRVPQEEIEARWPTLRSRLGDLLVNKNSGGYTLQIISLKGSEDADKLVALVRDLVADGVDEKFMTIGFENQGQDTIELRFVQGMQ
jgi:hypothetical protein